LINLLISSRSGTSSLWFPKTSLLFLRYSIASGACS
jgi:hypothetical protein